MHFWIDKSRFGGHPCAFGANRHRPIGGRRWRSPKPNVAPVHRFNSVENLHSPLPSHSHSPLSSLSPQASRHNAYAPSRQISACSSLPTRINVEEEGDADNIRLAPVYIHNMSYASASASGSGANNRTSVKIYGILPSLILALILIAYTKFYFDTQRGGYEMVTIIGIFGLFAIIWHAVYRSSPMFQTCDTPPQPPLDPAQIPIEAEPTPISTIPPPPYHIAVLLPSDPKDLPPPSYDHVTRHVRMK